MHDPAAPNPTYDFADLQGLIISGHAILKMTKRLVVVILIVLCRPRTCIFSARSYIPHPEVLQDCSGNYH